MSTIWNVPNILTMIRIGCIPLIVIVYYLPVPWAGPAAGLIFGAAAITDGIDGYLARRLGQTSAFGAFLDPVADKVIVATALIMIVQTAQSTVITLVAAIIIGREITISALREWMSEVGARHHVAVTNVAKYKTIWQMVGLSFMLYQDRILGMPIYETGAVLLVLAAIYTLWSMVTYLRVAWPELTGSRSQS